ncbi:enoyl-CoA hydratase-related protein [Kordiimonas sp. SCSIO 12610]|uniref:enoyl-CoA hydratase-related protein n=1 Tax=Kordiimonas sp. SCSIO 12610 TaxID=2829597 RepID=UPI00210C2FAA|nr:enoyl-CoA hydratase-related protein [Kordiimonas sp. SCSIO 12610]UTW54096.1 enoyl-CoA hydratase/isomerase family protein [Kordiimonas sp. SCSIO 12610]
MSDYETICLELDQNLAVLTLNRPQALNALSNKMKEEILQVIRHISNPKSGIRALMITGEGKGFCSGADLGEDKDTSWDAGANLIDTYHPLMLELMSLQIPVISAVNGVAAGAGMSLAISADIVVAAKSAYFLQAFVNIGLCPDAGSTYLLPRLIGEARAKAIMMLGEKVPAEKAKDWGMIYEVFEDEDLIPTARNMAMKIANGPSLAYAGIKKLTAVSSRNGYSDQLQAEALVQRMASQSGDAREGISAFLEKRKALFKGC